MAALDVRLPNEAVDAVLDGDLAALQQLLDEGVTLSISSELLCLAAANGRLAAVELLLSRGAEKDFTDYEGRTALMNAAMESHFQCVEALCEANAAVDVVHDDGSTALILAASNNNLQAVRILSSYGANRSLQDLEGDTAADAARLLGNHELLAWMQQSSDWTPLHHIEQLSVGRARALLHGGASLQAGAPSALERARTVGGEVGALLQAAARPWSPATHELFGPAARARAEELVRLLYSLRNEHLPNGMPRVDFAELVMSTLLRCVMTELVDDAEGEEPGSQAAGLVLTTLLTLSSRGRWLACP